MPTQLASIQPAHSTHQHSILLAGSRAKQTPTDHELPQVHTLLDGSLPRLNEDLQNPSSGALVGKLHLKDGLVDGLLPDLLGEEVELLGRGLEGFGLDNKLLGEGGRGARGRDAAGCVCMCVEFESVGEQDGEKDGGRRREREQERRTSVSTVTGSAGERGRGTEPPRKRDNSSSRTALEARSLTASFG